MFSEPPLTNGPTQAGIDALATVVGLLNEASLQAARQLLAAGGGSDFASLHPNQILLVAHEAQVLLGEDVDMSDYEAPLEGDPVALLRSAERLLRVEPARDYPAGTTRVVIDVLDLLADAEFLASR